MDIVRGPLDFSDRPELSWQASEVVRELDDRPHLMTRIQLRGGSFPHLDAQPFVRVRGRRVSVESWFAEVADDQASLTGYFPVDASMADGVIEYGYGSRVFGRVPGPFDPLRVEHLDRDRLPRDLGLVTERFIRRKQAGRVPPEIRMPEPRRRRRS
jgi:hypothetical protein